MLKLKPNRECADKDLPPGSPDAAMLARYPASTQRVTKPHAGCTAA
jgi:hypothetical protein